LGIFLTAFTHWKFPKMFHLGFSEFLDPVITISKAETKVQDWINASYKSMLKVRRMLSPLL
jgi:hypothetical protein